MKKIEESIAIFDQLCESTNTIYDEFARYLDVEVDYLKKNYDIQITLSPDSDNAECRLVKVIRGTIGLSEETSAALRSLAKSDK